MIRIEADATQSSHLEIMCAPVRLITNQSKIRVTLKRRVSKMVFWAAVIADRVSRRVRGALTRCALFRQCWQVKGDVVTLVACACRKLAQIQHSCSGNR